LDSAKLMDLVQMSPSHVKPSGYQDRPVDGFGPKKCMTSVLEYMKCI
jgi:hypothetical protein